MCVCVCMCREEEYEQKTKSRITTKYKTVNKSKKSLNFDDFIMFSFLVHMFVNIEIYFSRQIVLSASHTVFSSFVSFVEKF